jgi:phytoene synthase
MTASPQTDRDLVRLHWPVELRPAFDALFALDDAMAEAALTASQPALGAIKLAWWREALERLDTAPPPAEPRLRAAAAELVPRGISGARLALLEDGWLTLIDETGDPAKVEEHGSRLFAIGADLLGQTGFTLAVAGASWARADAARRTGEQRYLGEPPAPVWLPRSIRALTALAALAVRDQSGGWPPEAEATPQRSWTILRHRLTGRL